tara:strand:+ start:872 stop:1516 length:645 start_codon:yes stop_codon:yes gene_type:complete
MIYFRGIIIYFVLIFISFNDFLFSNNFKILVQINNQIVTNYDLQNEIRTQLFLRGVEINQSNVDKIKNLSMQNLINRAIKNEEIKRRSIENYNKLDLNNYIKKISSSLQVRDTDIREIMKNYEVNYETFVNSAITDLKWNSLIFIIYKNQLKINPLEIESEITSNLKNTNQENDKEEIEKLKNKIIARKKNEKLQLFSNSHFSDLKNNTLIEFK